MSNNYKYNIDRKSSRFDFSRLIEFSKQLVIKDEELAESLETPGTRSAASNFIINTLNGDFDIKRENSALLYINDDFNIRRSVKLKDFKFKLIDTNITEPTLFMEVGNGNIVVFDNKEKILYKFNDSNEEINKVTYDQIGFGDITSGAVDSEGNIFLTDPENSRIIKLTNDLEFILSWMSNKSGSFRIDSPTGIFIDDKDNMYVTDRFNHIVYKLDKDFERLNSYGNKGVSGLIHGYLSNPYGVVVDDYGNVYVSDYRNFRVVKLNREFNLIGVFGTGYEGKSNNELSNPTNLVIDGDGNLIIQDPRNDRLMKVRTSNMTFLSKLVVYGRVGDQSNIWKLKDKNQIVLVDSGTIVNSINYTENNPYYKEILDKYKVDIYDMRTKEDLEILWYPENILNNIEATKFIELYYESLVYYRYVLITPAFKHNPLYKNFIRMSLLFMTIDRYISWKMEVPNNIDLFNSYEIRNMFISFGMDHFSDFPTEYQRQILRNINEFIKKKGSDGAINDILDLFGFKNIQVYNYYLSKNYPKLPNGEKDWANPELVFIRNNMSNYNLSNNYNEKEIIPYDKIASVDPYWQATEEEILNHDFETVMTKILSTGLTIDLTQKTKDLSYLMSLTASLFHLVDQHNDGTDSGGKIDLNEFLTLNAIDLTKIPGTPLRRINFMELVVTIYVLMTKVIGIKHIRIPKHSAYINPYYGFNLVNHNMIPKTQYQYTDAELDLTLKGIADKMITNIPFDEWVHENYSIHNFIGYKMEDGKFKSIIDSVDKFKRHPSFEKLDEYKIELDRKIKEEHKDSNKIITTDILLHELDLTLMNPNSVGALHVEDLTNYFNNNINYEKYLIKEAYRTYDGEIHNRLQNLYKSKFTTNFNSDFFKDYDYYEEYLEDNNYELYINITTDVNTEAKEAMESTIEPGSDEYESKVKEKKREIYVSRLMAYMDLLSTVISDPDNNYFSNDTLLLGFMKRLIDRLITIFKAYTVNFMAYQTDKYSIGDRDSIFNLRVFDHMHAISLMKITDAFVDSDNTTLDPSKTYTDLKDLMRHYVTMKLISVLSPEELYKPKVTFEIIDNMLTDDELDSSDGIVIEDDINIIGDGPNGEVTINFTEYNELKDSLNKYSKLKLGSRTKIKDQVNVCIVEEGKCDRYILLS